VPTETRPARARPRALTLPVRRPPHRVALVTNGLARGGAETQLLHLAGGLLARGDEVGILSILPGVEFAEVETLRIPVACIGVGRTARGAVAIASGARILHAWAPDTVVSFVYQANVLGRCAGRLARVPTIVSSIRNEFFGGRRRELLLRVTDPLATLTTTNSSRSAASLVERGIVPADRIAVVPNGLDVAAFRFDAEVRARTRAHLALAPDDFLWLAAGRLQEQKDYPTLLRAVAMLRYPRPVVVIAGTGEQRRALERLAAQLGIAQRVRFLGLRDDVPDLLAAADAVVLSSAWEGSPNIVLEAMAASVPVAATDVGGVRELVDSGRTGFVVAPGRPKALVDAMFTVMALSPDERAAMGEAARAKAVREHSLTAVRDAWLGVLDRAHAFSTRHVNASTRRPLRSTPNRSRA
jgi:glycosyltransferase involved in cell wall biosynthesis